MKLTAHNLGRIKDAEIDIKPLTVFSGHNGTNKTWLAWTLYEVLQPLSSGPKTVDVLEFEGVDPLIEKVREKVKSLHVGPDSENLTVSITFDATTLDAWLNDALSVKLDHDRITALLGGDAQVASDAHVNLALSARSIGTRHRSVTLELTPDDGKLDVISNWEFADGTNRSIRRRATKPNWDEESFVTAATLSLRQVLLNVLYFPADRAGLLLATELINIDTESTDTDLPHPLENYLSMMRRMRSTRKESPLKEQLQPLLKSIAGGDIGVHRESSEEKLTLEVAGRRLPISVASSLSRSVAGFAQYIRTYASPGDVILIDELEMNAHPAAQLALVELMAVMVSYGIRIVFTTHSPYVIDHLNNLLEAGRAPMAHQEKLAEQFQLRTSRAFLPADKVAVYAFEATPDGSEVKVSDAIDANSGLITKSTFAPVTQRLSQLFNAALDASEDDT